MEENKVQKLLSDEKLLKEFLTQKDIKSVKEFLKSKGIEASTDELKIVAGMLKKYQEKGELLTDEELTEISGGAIITKRDAEKYYEKLKQKSKGDLIKSGIFAGTGICAGIVAYLTKGKTSGIAVGAGASAGLLSIYRLLKSGKNRYDASWWEKLAKDLA